MARRDRDQARRSVARLVSWVGEKSLGVEAAEAMARADLVEAVGERAARLEERAGLAAAEGAREARGELATLAEVLRLAAAAGPSDQPPPPPPAEGSAGPSS